MTREQRASPSGDTTAPARLLKLAGREWRQLRNERLRESAIGDRTGVVHATILAPARLAVGSAAFGYRPVSRLSESDVSKYNTRSRAVPADRQRKV